MTSGVLTIGDLKLKARNGEWTTAEGAQSESSLAVIRIPVTTVAPDEESMIRNTVSAQAIEVSDPVAGRSYSAKVSIRSESYRDGSNERHFDLEVAELDRPRPFAAVAIDGQQYAILHAKNMRLDDGRRGWILLLKVTEDELESVLELRERMQPCSAQRVGLDDVPEARVFGGHAPWSRHESEGKAFYKQTITLFPADHEFELSVAPFADGRVQRNLARQQFMIIRRFQVLIDALRASAVIGEATLAQLDLEQEGEERASTEPRFMWRLGMMKDAEEEWKKTDESD